MLLYRILKAYAIVKLIFSLENRFISNVDFEKKEEKQSTLVNIVNKQQPTKVITFVFHQKFSFSSSVFFASVTSMPRT